MPTQFIRMGFGIWDKLARLRMSDKDMNILKWLGGSGFLTRELQLHQEEWRRKQKRLSHGNQASASPEKKPISCSGGEEPSCGGVVEKEVVEVRGGPPIPHPHKGPTLIILLYLLQKLEPERMRTSHRNSLLAPLRQLSPKPQP